LDREEFIELLEQCEIKISEEKQKILWFKAVGHHSGGLNFERFAEIMGDGKIGDVEVKQIPYHEDNLID
jgi:hypothetical protein